LFPIRLRKNQARDSIAREIWRDIYLTAIWNSRGGKTIRSSFMVLESSWVKLDPSLRSSPAVSDAVVLVKKTSDERERLVAYVVSEKVYAGEPANSLNSISERELLEFLAERLPEYAIPSTVIFLNEAALDALTERWTGSHYPIQINAVSAQRVNTSRRVPRPSTRWRVSGAKRSALQGSASAIIFSSWVATRS